MTGQPDWLGADSRYLYVRQDSGEIAAIDPRTDRIAWRVQVPSDDLCQGLGVGFGSLWTCRRSPSSDTDDLVRISTRTHRVVATIEVGKSTRQGHLVTGFGRVWVINSTPAGSTLVGIDPDTEQPDDPIPLGILATELAIDDELIWAVGPVTGEVVGVDPRTHAVVRQVGGLDGLGGPSVVTVGAGYLWVSGEERTVGIDRAAGRVAVDVAEPAKGDGGLAASDTDLWIHSGDEFLLRVDPATGAVVERITAPDLVSAGDVLVAFGSVWASSNNQATLVRVAFDHG